MNYFTADLHLGSNEILARESRPFKDITEFSKYLLFIWNRELSKDDSLYIIGDFINYNRNNTLTLEEFKRLMEFIRQIKSRVVLLVGNGEERIIKELFRDSFNDFRDFCIRYGFEDVAPEKYLEFGDECFYLNHYPRKHKEGYVNLFGHTHRVTGLWKPYGLNVGCDLNHFRLYSESEILRLLDMKREYWDNDPDNLSL